MRGLLLFLYAAVGLLEVYAEYNNIHDLRHYTKPLLMPLLLGWYLAASSGTERKLAKFVIPALVFSWLGDMFLMFLPHEGATELWGIAYNENFFLAGLASFLLAHVAYILAFTLPFRHESQKGIIRSKPWIPAILLLYGIGLIYWLFPHLGEFMVPVIVYATVILLMVLFAINRLGRVNETAFWICLTGALLFMLSDSMIAINKWPFPFELSRPMIMITYISGQLGIVAGLVWGEE